MSDLIQQQIDYYRARAGEYDEWFYRKGRYDHGETQNNQWFSEADTVRQRLLSHERVEKALDLASGTGIWTQELLKIADQVTAVDASPEVHQVSAGKMPDAPVTRILADLFEWEADSEYDLAFFGFWLSHIPPERLDDFFAKVARAVKPGGTVFIMDSRNSPTSSAKDHEKPDGHTHLRRLNDGREFIIVKRFYEIEELSEILRRHGFEPQVHMTDNYFIYAEAKRMVDNKELSKYRFGKFAEAYVASKSHSSSPELGLLVEIAQPQPDWIVLDVATGGGHTALTFAPHVARVIASDITPRMLEKAEEFIRGKGVENVEFRIADAEALPFEDASFDLVTCRIAPHHFPNVFKFVQECARVLKPGGLLLVQDQMLPDEQDAAAYVDAFEKLRDPSHNRAYAAYEWEGMYLDAGLSIERREEVIKRHDFLNWARTQNASERTIEKLTVMLRQAPRIAAAWMDAKAVGSDEASFVNHHLILAGRKPA